MPKHSDRDLLLVTVALQVGALIPKETAEKWFENDPTVRWLARQFLDMVTATDNHDKPLNDWVKHLILLHSLAHPNE